VHQSRNADMITPNLRYLDHPLTGAACA
jgi:hypothetical protein